MRNKIWRGIGSEPWRVDGDGVLRPWCVYTVDASGVRVDFYPFGFSLPGWMEGQARALADLLNRTVVAEHKHEWHPDGLVSVHEGSAVTPADACACGAKRYAESSGHFGEPIEDVRRVMD